VCCCELEGCRDVGRVRATVWLGCTGSDKLDELQAQQGEVQGVVCVEQL
jgi:hypothetical protein